MRFAAVSGARRYQGSEHHLETTGVDLFGPNERRKFAAENPI